MINQFINNPSIGNELIQRKLIYQITSDLIVEKLNTEPITFYIGADLTAPSLHLGHSLWLKTVERLVKAGHHAIILLGGFTSKIGDPSGKTQARKTLDNETVNGFKEKIKKQIYKLMPENGSITIVDNYEWLGSMSYESFLDDYGKYISVNQMIKMETASERLNKQLHLSLLEFNYMVLQAIDFYYLFNKYNCILQLSGSDQWGNMLMGVDLIHKKLNETVFGLTLPLLLTSSGKKMGKTEEGAIWLDENMTNPYIMWQYIRNINDEDVLPMLYKFSDYSVEEINNFTIKKEINDLKIMLADEIITWIHGSNALVIIKQEIQRQFNKNGPQIFDLEEIKSSPSAREFTSNSIIGIELEELMVLTNLVDSKTEARRKITEKAVKINGVIVDYFKKIINNDCFINEVLCIDLGKKSRRYIFLNNENI